MISDPQQHESLTLPEIYWLKQKTLKYVSSPEYQKQAPIIISNLKNSTLAKLDMLLEGKDVDISHDDIHELVF